MEYRFLPTVAWLSLAVMGAGVARAQDDPRDRYILQELRVRSEIDCRNVALRDVVEYLSDLHRIPIYIDTEAFEKAGIVYDKLQFTNKLGNVPLWQILRDTLAQRKLSFMIKRHTLTITTPKEAKEWQETHMGARADGR